jgi:Tol biopolymer transport system component
MTGEGFQFVIFNQSESVRTVRAVNINNSFEKEKKMKTREKIMVVGVLAVMGLLAMCGSASADVTWTTPVPVTELNGGYLQITPFLTADGKSLYFTRADGPTSTNKESIYEATRQNPSSPFTSINKVLSDNYHAASPWVSADELRMYYHNESSSWRLKVSTRASINDPWSVGTGISELNVLGGLLHPRLTGDELNIFFDKVTSNTRGLWTATRTAKNLPFSNPRSLTELNTPSGDEGTCSVTADGLAIYFTSERNSSSGEIFKASRNSLNDPFGNVEHLSFLDSPGYVVGYPGISADGTALYFWRGNSSSVSDIYVTYIPEPATLLLLGLGAALIRKKV